jgi:molybdopterin-guanine dinucleotide biosynthesis protein A
MAATAGHDIVLAERGGRLHPVFGVWSRALHDDLEDALRAGVRKVEAWARGYRLTTVSFDDDTPIDPFFNINTPEDLKIAEAYCASTAT